MESVNEAGSMGAKRKVRLPNGLCGLTDSFQKTEMGYQGISESREGMVGDFHFAACIANDLTDFRIMNMGNFWIEVMFNLIIEASY